VAELKLAELGDELHVLGLGQRVHRPLEQLLGGAGVATVEGGLDPGSPDAPLALLALDCGGVDRVRQLRVARALVGGGHVQEHLGLGVRGLGVNPRPRARGRRPCAGTTWVRG